MDGKQPSRKKRLQQKAAKKRQEARKQAAEGHMAIGGQVVDLECRLDLVVCHPSSDSLHRQITGIVDTGCTRTAIRSDIAGVLNLPVIGTAQVHAFGGVSQTDLVAAKLVILSEGKAVGSLRALVVGDEQEMPNELLFGMDALVGGVLEVDMVHGRWKWRLMRIGSP